MKDINKVEDLILEQLNYKLDNDDLSVEELNTCTFIILNVQERRDRFKPTPQVGLIKVNDNGRSKGDSSEEKAI